MYLSTNEGQQILLGSSDTDKTYRPAMCDTEASVWPCPAKLNSSVIRMIPNIYRWFHRPEATERCRVSGKLTALKYCFRAWWSHDFQGPPCEGTHIWSVGFCMDLWCQGQNALCPARSDEESQAGCLGPRPWLSTGPCMRKFILYVDLSFTNNLSAA